jgi:1,4-alpha-glucan branching enzyme
MTNSTVLYPEWFTADELYLFGEGRYFRAYQKLGAHLAQVDGKRAYTLPFGHPMRTMLR